MFRILRGCDGWRGRLALYQKSGLRSLVHDSGVLKLFPERLQAMERLLPPISFGALRRPMPARVPAEGPGGGVWDCCSVASSGCSSATSMRATARVLAAEGCDVVDSAGSGVLRRAGGARG